MLTPFFCVCVLLLFSLAAEAGLIKDLEAQMKEAAKALEYERAALLRDQVIELRRTLAVEEPERIVPREFTRETTTRRNPAPTGGAPRAGGRAAAGGRSRR